MIDMLFRDTIFLVDSAVAFFSRINCYFLRENELSPILRLQTGRPKNLRSVSGRVGFIFHHVQNSLPHSPAPPLTLPSLVLAEEE